MFCSKLIYRVLSNQSVKVLPTRRFASTKAEVTALYDFHVENGGKMVDFGGYLLPVQYNDLGIAASHLHTRKSASLFDVSHMLQTEIKGAGCIPVMESICTADLQSLPNNSSVLTVFTTPQGGILDDLIITKINDTHLYVVSNAAMKHQDQKIISTKFNTHNKSKITVKFFEPLERGLVALQGPLSSQILQNYTNTNLSNLYFMQSTEAEVCGVTACRITRCGYTGEDGFEISIPAIKISDVCRELLSGSSSSLKLAGLGARDSLRLEAGLCLYGSDITQSTTPVQAGLTWLVQKKRRVAPADNFPGASTILKEIKEGSERKRVGLVAESGPPARHGTVILDGSGAEVGVVTSGCPSPSLSKNISMGYVPTAVSKAGTQLQLRIRDKLYAAVVTKMPFVKSNYYSKPK